MPQIETATRTKSTPTTGTKITLLIASLFVVAAIYFLFLPLDMPGGSGSRFGCQSAFNPPTDQFPKNVCGSLNHVYQLRAAAMLASALLIAGLGVAFFGVNRRTETRKVTDAAVDKKD